MTSPRKNDANLRRLCDGKQVPSQSLANSTQTSVRFASKFNSTQTSVIFASNVLFLAKVTPRRRKLASTLFRRKGSTQTGAILVVMAQARYITHIARTHMIPPLFALVHPKTGTPINANLLIAIPSALIAFFSGLDVLASLISISTLFIFTMMPIALLVRRYYVKEITPKTDLRKLIICLLIIVASSMGTSACWGMQRKGSWIGYTITVPFWLVGTLGIVFFVPQQRTPKVWGVPLVPWLPCLSIATNIFLMGSLGAQAFVRFGVCTLVMLLYYFLFGLHATFDLAHHLIVPKS